MTLSPGKIATFFTEDIWRIRLRRQPKGRSFLIRNLRIALVALRGFYEDKCQLRASALTFYTLLSIVPIVAMAFGVAKGFGFEKMLENKILESAGGQGEVIGEVVGFAKNLLDNTKGGLVAGIGVAVLFWSVIKVLGNIEKSFNEIWGIKKGRTLVRKFSEYVSVMLLAPLLLILASSVTVFITTRVESMTESVTVLSAVGPAIRLLLRILPYCLIWVLFTFIYIFIPNTRVRFTAGLTGGIIAGSVYVIVQWAYITFQVGIAKYNAIYGSFAALPLFLVWLQLSWLIVLFGAEISFAHQNVETYEFDPDTDRVSTRFKRLVALSVTRHVINRFASGRPPQSETEISREMEIPIRLLRQVLFELGEGGVLVEIAAGNGGPPAYQPARDIALITVKYVTDALDHRGVDNLELAPSEDFLQVREQVRKIDDLAAKSPENILLKDLE